MRTGNCLLARISTIALLFLLISANAQAQSALPSIDATTVLGLLKAAMAPAVSKLASQAISWLGVLATLQFFITNYNLLKSDGDLQAVVAKMVGAVAWVGIVIYLINNGPKFISGVGDQFFGLLGLDMPSPGTVIAYTVGATTATALAAAGVGAIPFAGPTPGIYLVYISLGILAIGMYMAFKIFMLQLEMALIAMLSPLSFALLGLNTLKDQGIAPFKALLSLGYRIILLTVILSAFGQIAEILKQITQAIDTDNFTTAAAGFFEALWATVGAYLLIFYLTFKSDSIAATLASGGTSMGTGDVAQAAAAGAAMGAAVASGGATAAATAGQVPATMREFMGNMMGGGTVNNASAMGNAAEPPPLPKPSSPAAFSVGGTSSTGPVSSTGSVTSQGTASHSPSATTGAGATHSEAVAQSPSETAQASEGGAAASSAPNDSESPVRGQGSQAGQRQAASVTTGRIGPDLSDSQSSGAAKPPAAIKASPVLPTGSVPSQGKAMQAQGSAPTVRAPQGDAMAQHVSAANRPSHANVGAPAYSPTSTPEPSVRSQGSGSQAGPIPDASATTGRIGPDISDSHASSSAGSQPAPESNMGLGSGSTAGIAGKPDLAERLGDLVDHLAKQNAPRTARLGDRLSEANRHMEKESGGTHVSMNVHQSD